MQTISEESRRCGHDIHKAEGNTFTYALCGVTVVYRPQSLKLFGSYPDEVLLELSRYAVYTSFLGKVTRKLERGKVIHHLRLHKLSSSVSNAKHFSLTLAVYRPGEEGHYWYAVISGSLEMLDVDSNDSEKVCVCVYRITTPLHLYLSLDIKYLLFERR